MSFVGKTLLMAFGFISITTPGALGILQRRGGQSDVICPGDFTWAQNAQGLNPCIVAASVQAACVSTDFQVNKLNGTDHYNVLLDPTACSCSWAAYNLLGACTACQGYTTSIQTWASISTSQQCKPFLSNTYFPPGTIIEGGRTIPYWATINPTTWQDGSFNVAQAQGIAAQHHADVNPATASTKKKPPIGAIVGGVLGGIVILVLGAYAAWVLYRKKRMSSGPRPLSGGVLSHVRSFSDMSQKTGTSYYGVPQPGRLAAPTIRTHGTASVHSLPIGPGSPPATASLFSIPVSTRQVASPPPQHLQPPEDRIEPFTLVTPPSSPTNRPPMHRKGTSDDSTTSAPVSRAEEHNTATRRRLNPPAYSGPTGGNGSGHRPGHGLNPNSFDSQLSWDSQETRSTHAVHGSLVGVANHDRQNGNTEDSVQIA